MDRSRPTRGAWIEIMLGLQLFADAGSRAPHGARGLKSESAKQTELAMLSRPTRGAWIEMLSSGILIFTGSVAPHTGRVD